jgi:hypothetical protein
MSENRELYATILGFQVPWQVTSVELRAKDQEVVVVTIVARPSTAHACPICEARGVGRDGVPGIATRPRDTATLQPLGDPV